jgi:hypothetical protein
MVMDINDNFWEAELGGVATSAQEQAVPHTLSQGRTSLHATMVSPVPAWAFYFS